MGESKANKRKVVAFAWFSKNNRALQIGFVDSTGQIDDKKTFVCFVDALINAFSGFEPSAEVYESFPLEKSVEIKD